MRNQETDRKEVSRATRNVGPSSQPQFEEVEG